MCESDPDQAGDAAPFPSPHGSGDVRPTQSTSDQTSDLNADLSLDPDQLARVSALLRAEPASQHPQEIGRYRICSVIGQGGMGVVYAAEQREPVRRQVALKLIKAGMDTGEVLARFGAERQALAILDHPNIAKVLDAGATDSGRPYFVMEFVPGRPITEYCDTRRLTTRRRLELFANVCDAVQHAHTKGIIHRDIKASNVLVAERDDRPEPKLIDFGVAKATAQRLTNETLFTQQGVLIGTPEYMSPEQAAGGFDIDTRSDIYSLGVLLYELLTGALPLERGTLRVAAYHDIQRIIREVEPPRPSTRLSKLGAEAAKIAERRASQVSELTSELKRELDWIPLKALRKERAERYRTATELADDVRNYLSGRPLIAAPPSQWYRARKFVRRNRAAVATVMAIALALVAGAVGTTLQAVRATRAERRANEEKLVAQRHFNDVRALANKFMFEFYAKVSDLPGSTPAVQMLVNTSLEYLNKLSAESSDPELLRELAQAYRKVGDVQGNPNINANLGDVRGAHESYLKSQAILERLRQQDPNDPANASNLSATLIALGDIELWSNRPKSAAEAYRHARELLTPLSTSATQRATPDREQREFMISSKLGDTLVRLGDGKGAAKEYGVARSLAQRRLDAEPNSNDAARDVMIMHNKIGDLLTLTAGPQKALDEFQQGMTIAKRLADSDQNNSQFARDLAISYANLGEALRDLNRLPESLEQFRGCLAIQKRAADADPNSMEAQRQLHTAEMQVGQVMYMMEDAQGALEHFRSAEQAAQRVVRADPRDSGGLALLAGDQVNLARCLASLKNKDEAVAYGAKAVETFKKLLDARPDDDLLHRNLSVAYESLGMVQAGFEEYEAAIASFQRSVAIDRERVVKNRGNRETRRMLAVDLMLLATTASSSAADDKTLSPEVRVARLKLARDCDNEVIQLVGELRAAKTITQHDEELAQSAHQNLDRVGKLLDTASSNPSATSMPATTSPTTSPTDGASTP